MQIRPSNNVANALAGSLAEIGTDHVFCLMGEANLDFVAALRAEGINVIHGRHEQGVVEMADGYARFSRESRAGIATVTLGPGLTNATTSILTAVAGRSKLLLLAGDAPAAGTGSFDQQNFVKQLGALSLAPSSSAEVIAHTQQALDYLYVNGGAAVLNISSPVWEDSRPHESHVTPPGPPHEAAHIGLVFEAAQFLQDSARPAILVGRGAVISQAEDAVIEIAHRIGAPIITTVPANGFAATSEHMVGMAGSLAAGCGSEALHQADCVLVIGSSLTQWTTDEGTALYNKKIIRIDTNPTEYPALWLVGDARLTSEVLVQQLENRQRQPWFSPSLSDQDTVFVQGEGTVDPRQALLALDDALPKERSIVLDGGQHAIFALRLLKLYEGNNFGWTSDFGAIGQGLAFAIGAAFARPSERITAVMGDGGFLMSVAELDTAVRYNVPVTIFVLNDGGYGQERGGLAAKRLSPDEADIPTPDIAAIAREYGAQSHRISSLEELSTLESALDEADGPIVFDVRINSSVTTGFHERIAAYRQMAQYLGISPIIEKNAHEHETDEIPLLA